jgi:sigma-B regulation protein RsbU (phosphoserine phosphatase)
MFLGVMDLSTGVVRYCNAGHNPPILIRNGQAQLLDTEPSLLLGIEMEAAYTAHELTLSPGDTIFLYTDGLTEAENVQKELFGERRALATAAAHAAMTVQEQLEEMRSSVQAFVGDAEQSDDLTLLAVRYNQATDSTLTLSNDINELDRLEPFLEEFFDQNSLSPALLSSVDLALEEALANVIMYAYPEGEKGDVTLSTHVKDNIIYMKLSDKGIPFNPLEQKEADLNVSLEERKIGGLGIHLIKEIMDEVAYAHEDGKNVLKMQKKLVVSS